MLFLKDFNEKTKGNLKLAKDCTNTKTTPIKKDPIRLAIRVAQGNKATEKQKLYTVLKSPKLPLKLSQI